MLFLYRMVWNMSIVNIQFESLVIFIRGWMALRRYNRDLISSFYLQMTFTEPAHKHHAPSGA